MKTIIQRINDLASYLDNNDQNRDAAFEVICELRQAHEDASKGEYSKQELTDMIFYQNNCLAAEGANNLPEEMLEEIKKLQHEIVDAYGFQD